MLRTSRELAEVLIRSLSLVDLISFEGTKQEEQGKDEQAFMSHFR
jgi:hypothetical protein